MAFIASLRNDSKSQLSLVEQAVDGLSAIKAEQQLQLARSHLALARLDAGELQGDSGLARAIAEWGDREGSFSYALGLGLLFTRAGRQALLRHGDYERAEACFELASALNDGLGARLRLAQSRADLAALHHALGSRDRARTYHEEAISTLSNEAATQSDTARTANQRGAILLQQLYRDALDHRDANGMEWALGRAPTLTPNQEPASWAVAGLWESTRTQGSVLIPLYKAVDERNAGHTDQASALFRQALLQAARVRGTEGLFLTALAHGQQHDYDQAVRAFDDYLRGGGAGAGFAGSLLEALRRLSPAQGQREFAESLRRTAEQAFSFMVRMKAFTRAQEYLEQIERLAGREWWQGDARPWQPLSDIGEMYEGLNEHGRALEYYEAAIAQLQARRQRLSRDELRTALAADFGAEYLYFQAVRAALKWAEAESGSQNLLARAFALSEQGRARGLLDLLTANAGLASRPTGRVSELAHWRELQARSQLWRGLLAEAQRKQDRDHQRTLEEQVKACESELRRVTDLLAAKLPGFAELVRGEAQVVSVDRIAHGLDSSQAVLMYMALGEELLLWGITDQGMCGQRIIPLSAAVLARRVNAFCDGCAHGDSVETLSQQATELGEILLAPLAEIVDSHERLLIVPYGALHRLPFGALRYRGDWLAARHTLSVLPSASVGTLLAREPKPGPWSVLAVGNPANMRHEPPFGKRQELQALAYAEFEAQHVAELFGTQAVVGPAATESHVRAEMSTKDILHFATHGLLYEEAPLLSGIALANGDVLRVDELMGLRLKARLVTLSACRTGLGLHRGGEEIIGLARGLLAAGAQSALVTLWSVLDGSTAVMMERFYDCFKELKDPAAALRSAQASMRLLKSEQLAEVRQKRGGIPPDSGTKATCGEHPLHWAGFFVVGGQIARSEA